MYATTFLLTFKVFLQIIMILDAFYFRGSRSEDRDYQEKDTKESEKLEDDYNWEYNSGDYDHYQYGGHDGYNQYGDQDVGNHTNDYHDGDYQWQHGIEQRGESFWRSECRNWNAEEVRGY